jgi:serine/threonine protein kinase
MKLIIKGKGEETLDKRHYISSGGEGSIYVKNGIAYKIYTKQSHMIPEGKIMELSVLTSPEIIKPEKILLDTGSTPVGYTMKYIQHTVSICQAFTKAFKDRNNIKPKQIIELVKQFRGNVQHCHDKNILIVDLNEMNFLINKDKFDTIYFIDVDSYQTKSYPATAIMDSIRDRHSKKFDENTDWFSFGIITFQLFTGLHPYKGKHATIKSLDERMLKNVSIFNKDVSIPPTAADPAQSVPRAFLEWYRAIFEDGKRFPFPTDTDTLVIVQAPKVRVLSGTDNFDIKELFKFEDDIIYYKCVNGDNIFITTKGLYKETSGLDDKVKANAYIGVTPIYQQIISATIENRKLQLYNVNTGLNIPFDFIAMDLFAYKDRIYVVHGEHISELQFTEPFPNKTFVSIKPVCNIIPNATQIFDGMALQNLLGMYHASIFPIAGNHYQIKLPELSGYRVIDAKYQDRVMMIIGEQKGKYDKFIFCFDETFNYTLRKLEDISSNEINFTVLDNGICVHGTESCVELFHYKKINDIKQINDNILFDTKLCNKGNDVYFIKDNKMFSLKMKPKP